MHKDKNCVYNSSSKLYQKAVNELKKDWFTREEELAIFESFCEGCNECNIWGRDKTPHIKHVNTKNPPFNKDDFIIFEKILGFKGRMKITIIQNWRDILTILIETEKINNGRLTSEWIFVEKQTITKKTLEDIFLEEKINPYGRRVTYYRVKA